MRAALILTKLRTWCLLLLAAIAMQALVPISAPEARTTGSPLNPSTIDVSIGHVRRDIADTPAVVRRASDDGGTPVIVPAEALRPAIVLAAAAAPAKPFDAWAGPALARRAPSPASPRAPPPA